MRAFCLLALWFLDERLPVIRVDIVVLSGTFPSGANVNELKHIVFVLPFVVSAFKGIQFALPRVFGLIAGQTNTVQVKFLFNFGQGFLQCLCPFQRVIEDLVNGMLRDLEIRSGYYFLRSVLEHGEDLVI